MQKDSDYNSNPVATPAADRKFYGIVEYPVAFRDNMVSMSAMIAGAKEIRAATRNYQDLEFWKKYHGGQEGDSLLFYQELRKKHSGRYRTRLDLAVMPPIVLKRRLVNIPFYYSIAECLPQDAVPVIRVSGSQPLMCPFCPPRNEKEPEKNARACFRSSPVLETSNIIPMLHQSQNKKRTHPRLYYFQARVCLANEFEPEGHGLYLVQLIGDWMREFALSGVKPTRCFACKSEDVVLIPDPADDEHRGQVLVCNYCGESFPCNMPQNQIPWNEVILGWLDRGTYAYYLERNNDDLWWSMATLRGQQT